MAKFTVDTHLFRELGELLVGRDSTALVELIKNSYDADATKVTVYGENLDKPSSGRIVITDDGIGMTPEVFERGFLRIASRVKEEGDRRSPHYKRRYTGAKGVGRLAAQKLAWNLSALSVPSSDIFKDDADGVQATIDWKKIDECETLDDEEIDQAINVEPVETDNGVGTEIELTRLRGKWTASERTRVIREVSTFQPPNVLIQIPGRIIRHDLLFDEPLVRDIEDLDDPGFTIHLQGDFDVGDEYWNVVAEATNWILEIESDHDTNSVTYLITPTKAFLKQFPDAEQHEFQ